jgi:hypothetical protein
VRVARPEVAGAVRRAHEDAIELLDLVAVHRDLGADADDQADQRDQADQGGDQAGTQREAVDPVNQPV